MRKWEVYAAMREEGLTYTEIARRCGVSHQCVAQAIGKHGGIKRFRKYTPEECIYDGLRNWMNENIITRRELERIISPGHCCGGSWHSLCKNWLSGRSKLNMGHIDRLIDASGLTYEQLFRSGRWCEDDGAKEGE